MFGISEGQNLRKMYWEPVETDGWLTACAPLGCNHQDANAVEWDLAAPLLDEPFEADSDIMAGRVRSFDNIESLIADLKSPVDGRESQA